MILSKYMRRILTFVLGLITLVIIILFNTPSQAVTIDDIDNFSALTTVLIGQPLKEADGSLEAFNPGSGVIISRQGNTYSVITNTHVVKNQSSEKWMVITWDEKPHIVQDIGKNIIRFGTYKSRTEPIDGFDLAVVTFTSQEDYPVAVMGDSQKLQVDETVYISGWPKPEENQTESRRVFREGKLAKIANPPSENGGYNIMYNNVTRPGMSGSAVYNSQGEIIGIHAAGRRKGDIFCVDPDLNYNNSCGIQAIHFIQQAEAKRVKLAYNSPPINPSVIAKGRANKAEADVIRDYYKLFSSSRSQIRDCPTGVLIDEPGCENGF